jgi:hypothetical protein
MADFDLAASVGKHKIVLYVTTYYMLYLICFYINKLQWFVAESKSFMGDISKGLANTFEP